MDISKKYKDRKSLPGEALKELQALVDALPLDPVQRILAEHARHSTSELDRGLLSIPLEERRLRGISARTDAECRQETAEQRRIDASLHASESRYRQHEIGQEALMQKAARLDAEALVETLGEAKIKVVPGNNHKGHAVTLVSGQSGSEPQAKQQAPTDGIDQSVLKAAKKPNKSREVKRKKGGYRESTIFIRAVLDECDPERTSNTEAVDKVYAAIDADLETKRPLWTQSATKELSYLSAAREKMIVDRRDIVRSVKRYMDARREQAAQYGQLSKKGATVGQL